MRASGAEIRLKGVIPSFNDDRTKILLRKPQMSPCLRAGELEIEALGGIRHVNK